MGNMVLFSQQAYQPPLPRSFRDWHFKQEVEGVLITYGVEQNINPTTSVALWEIDCQLRLRTLSVKMA